MIGLKSEMMRSLEHTAWSLNICHASGSGFWQCSYKELVECPLLASLLLMITRRHFSSLPCRSPAIYRQFEHDISTRSASLGGRATLHFAAATCFGETVHPWNWLQLYDYMIDALLLLKVIHDHSNLHCCVGFKFLLVFRCNYFHSVPFLRYSTSNNVVRLKSRLRVIQDHWKWHHWIDCIRVHICLSLSLWTYLVSF